MVFCAGLAIGIIKAGYVEPVNMSRETYIKTIVPIGFLYSGTLWLGNAAYLYLSVSFIQMLKASTGGQQAAAWRAGRGTLGRGELKRCAWRGTRV